MKRSIPRHLLAVAAKVLVGGGMFVTASPTPALEHPKVTVGEGDSFSKQYPIIPGNNPANQASDPETCKLSVYCDTIRLTINPPSDPEAGHFVRIVMSWKTRAEADVPVEGEVTDNDMDLFVYQVPYDRSKTRRQNQVTSGATAAQPETAYVGPAGDYDLVVVNFLGVNEAGYTLTFTYVAETDFTPFELLADDSFPVDEDLGGSVTTAPAAPPASIVGDTLASPFLDSPIDLDPVTSFDDPFGLASPISSVSNAAGDILRDLDDDERLGPPRPVSALEALFWLVVLPAAVVGGASWWFARRRRAAFA